MNIYRNDPKPDPPPEPEPDDDWNWGDEGTHPQED